MRKLALNDEILLNIEKPARYIGNEVNSVMKDKDQLDIRFAMCFPDVSEIHRFFLPAINTDPYHDNISGGSSDWTVLHFSSSPLQNYVPYGTIPHFPRH